MKKAQPMNNGEKPRASRPNRRECAMLVVHLIDTKQKEVTGKEVTRARLSEIALQRLFKRQRISPRLLLEVQEWLFRVGWVLFWTGTTYAVVKTKVVEGWGRISSKRISEDLAAIGRGEFDFADLEHLLLEIDKPVEEEE